MIVVAFIALVLLIAVFAVAWTDGSRRGQQLGRSQAEHSEYWRGRREEREETFTDREADHDRWWRAGYDARSREVEKAELSAMWDRMEARTFQQGRN